MKISNFTAVKKSTKYNDESRKNYSMKKTISKNCQKNEPWFKWLIRELNSYEAFQDFSLGKNPEDVAEDFIEQNRIAIAEVFENFDEEDKDTLKEFLKLTECEWHVFRMLEKQLLLKNKVRYVNFQKIKN